MSTPRAPRLSGMPTPGRPSGIPSSGLPTPSRRKSSSLAPADLQIRAPSAEDENLLRHLTEAHPPSSFRSPSVASFTESAGEGFRRPGSAASHTSETSFQSSVGGGGRNALGLPNQLGLPRTPAGASRTPSLRVASSHRTSTAFPNTPTAKSLHTPRRSLAGPGMRPPSRQDEDTPPPVPKAKISNGGGSFSVGDKVRMDSMGMEGTMRFVGSIDGKPGVWAGVELSGGFAGRGKNDGSVDGKSYFSCPAACGIFLQYSKLSAPTTGPSYSRSSSVASNRSSVRDSRPMTPSFLSRSTTSSASVSGRGTPDGGMPKPRLAAAVPKASKLSDPDSRDSPSSRPSAINLEKSLSKSTTTTPRPSRVSNAFGQPTPTRASFGPRHSLSAASVNSTNTPGRSGRASAAGVCYTPASEMPPPPSPSRNRLPNNASTTTPARPASRQSDTFGSRSQSRQSDFGGRDSSMSLRPPTPKSAAMQALEHEGSALEEQIAKLMGKSASESGESRRTSGGSVSTGGGLPAGDGDLHVASHTDSEYYELVERLRSQKARIDALEKENLGLLLDKADNNDGDSPSRQSATSKPTLSRSPSTALSQSSTSSVSNADPSLESRAVAAERQVQAHTTRLTILESELSASTATVTNLQSTISSLETSNQSLIADHERDKAATNAQMREMKAKLEESEALVEGLKGAVEGKESGEGDKKVELEARKKEIEVLQGKVGRLSGDLEKERTELGGQVMALRQAGQDTISLYEERLNAAEALRLDMEIHIRSLQDQLEHLASSSSSTAPSSTFDPSSSSSMSSSSRTTADDRPSAAIQIDNENLTDQVRHLTGKITSLEEMLEDFQVQAEKDETAAKGRLERSKEQEEKLKRDIREARGQTDEVVKLENGARIRIGELEEALKEGAIALENARAELEETRAELAQLEDQANGTVTDENDRLLESAKRSEAEKARLTEEILQLKQLLEDSRASKREALETAEDAKRELEEKDREIEDLKADWKTALMENDDLLADKADLETKLLARSISFPSRPSATPSSPNHVPLSDLTIAKAQHARELDAKTLEIQTLMQKIATFSSSLDDGASPSKGSPTLSVKQLKPRRSRSSLGSHKGEDEIKDDQLKGFQHMVETLQTENFNLREENKLLLSKTEQLQEDFKGLELAFEQNILAEEVQLDREEASSSNTDPTSSLAVPPACSEPPRSPAREIAELQKSLAEAKIALDSQAQKHERDYEALTFRLVEMDETTQTEVQEAQRKAREAQRNYDDLKRKLEPSSSGSPFGDLSTPNSAAVKKSSNGTRSAKPSTGLPKLGSHAARTASRENACELCGDVDHDTEDCRAEFDDDDGLGSEIDPSPYTSQHHRSQDNRAPSLSPLSHKSNHSIDGGRGDLHWQDEEERTDVAPTSGGREAGPFCDDCEAYGHSTENCEYAGEVF